MIKKTIATSVVIGKRRQVLNYCKEMSWFIRVDDHLEPELIDQIPGLLEL